jgi:N-dimethylarginine dimethylaminohydrolase
MIAGPQLTDLFGAGPAKYIASAAGLVNLMINSVMVALTGAPTQDQQVRSVLAMGGVERIEVNKDASVALARLAVDPQVNKIAPSQDAQQQVEATAAKAA